MRLGIMTGGGDCSGLNAAVRAVVRSCETMPGGGTVIGYSHGWRGVVEGRSTELSSRSTDPWLTVGGTMLGTARFHPGSADGSVERIVDTLRHDRVDALVVVGGDGTLTAAVPVAEAGVRIIAIPKTIDNDVQGTDRSIGFDTALAVATEAVDRVRTTAESHDRLMVVEVMGHSTGWLALGAGLAGGAHAILVPEVPFDIDQVAAALCRRHGPTTFSVVVVAEGAVPVPGTLDVALTRGPFGSIVAGAIGERVRSELADRTGFESRLVVLGHVQRGGSPTATDRLLAARFAVDAVAAAANGAGAVMTALVGDEVRLVPLSEVAGGWRPAPRAWLQAADVLVG